jgi:hypothetical protein
MVTGVIIPPVFAGCHGPFLLARVVAAIARPAPTEIASPAMSFLTIVPSSLSTYVIFSHTPEYFHIPFGYA